MLRTLLIPISHPDPEYCDIPSRPDPLASSSQEATKLKSVLDHFSDEALKLAERECVTDQRALGDVEKMYLSEEMVLRYLKATRWNIAAAIKRLEATIIWRRTLNMYDVEGCAKDLEPEFDSGKIAIIGYTRLSQPVLYSWTARNATPPTFTQVKHIMFCMERTIDLQLAGVPGVMFCADVSGKTQTQSGAMGVSRQILSFLQAHYPERLGGAGLLKMPWLGSLFVTLLWPFIDADTRRKIHVNPDLSKSLIASDQLLDLYGGDIKFEWTKEYLPSLVELCVKRRAGNLRRWKEMGGRIGLSEWDFLERAGGKTKTAGGTNGVNGIESTPASKTVADPPVSAVHENADWVDVHISATPPTPVTAS